MAVNGFMLNEKSLSCTLCSKLCLERDATILTHHHSNFCMECLQQLNISNSEITCLCNEKTQLAKNQICNLEKNILKDVKTVKLCPKHSKELSLFCKVHNIGNLCTKCFEECHLNCENNTQENLLEKYIDEDKSYHKAIYNRIDQLQKIWILKVEKNFTALKKKVQDVSDKRINILNDLFKQDITLKKNCDELKEFLNKKIEFELLNDFSLNYSLENMDYIQRFVKGGRKLQFSAKCKTDKEINYAIEMIHSNSDVESIDLSCNKKLGDDKFSKIFQQLYKSSTVLKELKCSNCDLSENNMEAIENLISNCSNIEKINISKNSNKGTGISKIVHGLFNSSNSLKELNFSFCDLDKSTTKNIGILLNCCNSIENIDLSGNLRIANRITCVFLGLLNSTNTLKEIHLLGCDLAENECINIGHMLMNFPKIEIINISENENMGNGVSSICSGLVTSADSLKEIYMRNCNLDGYQSSCLGNLLKNCSKFKIIDLSGNSKMTFGFFNICQGLLRSSNTLEEILFIGCDLKRKQRKQLEKMFHNKNVFL
ncbi:unnamed protein product [Dimorphilus gyrociliatus]|uniref:Uncharacterized protein n=1 Tax=Dimorphilus gyrociliatus TaxID=2664684 RepID=A0A7I8WDS3_9ANNE|nr:unnamed protein product [Dimorphilus gyrociliatus]